MAAPAARQRMASAAISAGERGTAGFRSGPVTPLIAASMITGVDMGLSYSPTRRQIDRAGLPTTAAGQPEPSCPLCRRPRRDHYERVAKLASVAQRAQRAWQGRALPVDARQGGSIMPHRFEADGYRDLLPSLEGHFASLLARHKEAAGKTAWTYPQFLPLEAFRANAIEQPTLSATAYLAVETALLTEVNLPWYTAGLSRGLESCPGPIQEFVRVWTSEEDQHATLLESYLLLTGGGDHAARARSRKAMIAGGWSHTLAGPFEGMVYTAMQEAATRTFYLCAARACGEESPTLASALRRIAKDETLHMAFYRDVVKAHLDLDSNYLRPLAAVMLRFEMPWAASVLRDLEGGPG